MTLAFLPVSKIVLPMPSRKPGGGGSAAHEAAHPWAETFAAMNQPERQNKSTTTAVASRSSTKGDPAAPAAKKKDGAATRDDASRQATPTRTNVQGQVPPDKIDPAPTGKKEATSDVTAQADDPSTRSHDHEDHAQDQPQEVGSQNQANVTAAVPGNTAQPPQPAQPSPSAGDQPGAGPSTVPGALTADGVPQTGQADQASEDGQSTLKTQNQAQTQRQPQAQTNTAVAGQTAPAMADTLATPARGQTPQAVHPSTQYSQPQILANPDNAKNADGQSSQQGQTSSDGSGHQAQSGKHHAMTQADATSTPTPGGPGGVAASLPGAADQSGAPSSSATSAGPQSSTIQVVHTAVSLTAHAGVLAHHDAGAALSPAQALINAQGGDDVDPNVARIAQGLRSVINLRGGALTIRMNPADLGSVRIDMNINNGVINAQLQTQHASVRDLLAHQIEQLRDTLQSRGLTVQRLEVQGPTANNHSRANGQAQHSPDQGRSRGQFFHQNSSGGQGQGHGQSSSGQGHHPRDSFDMMLVDMVG